MYLDLLIFLCALVNYFFLLVTSKLFRRRSVLGRLIAAAVAGALPGFLVIFPPNPALNMIAIIAAPLIMIVIAFWPLRLLEVFLLSVSFFMIAFMTGGALLALTAGGDILLHSYQGVAALFGVCLLFYLLFSMLRPYHEERKWQRVWQMVLVVSWRGQKKAVPAYLDTGNRLRDPLSRLPVIVIDFRSLEGLLPQPVYRSLADPSGQPWLAVRQIEDYRVARSFTLLPYRGIGSGREILLGLIPDAVFVSKGEQRWELNSSVVLGLTRRGFGPVSEYRALLPPEVVGAV